MIKLAGLGYNVSGMQDAVSKMTSSLASLEELFGGNLENAIRDLEENAKSQNAEEALNVYYGISGNFSNFRDDLNSLISFVNSNVIPEYEKTEKEFNKNIESI